MNSVGQASEDFEHCFMIRIGSHLNYSVHI